MELLKVNQVFFGFISIVEVDWERVLLHLLLYLSHANFSALFFGLLFLFDLHLLFEALFDGLLADDKHERVEVLFCPMVGRAVKQDLRADVNASLLSNKEPFNPLKHLQELQGSLAPIIIIVAQLKHYYPGKDRQSAYF